jgi:hypothetical protein
MQKTILLQAEELFAENYIGYYPCTGSCSTAAGYAKVSPQVNEHDLHMIQTKH